MSTRVALKHGKVRLHVISDPDVPKEIVGDLARWRQLLLNLAGNSSKFCADGHIVVRARRFSEKALYEYFRPGEVRQLRREEKIRKRTGSARTKSRPKMARHSEMAQEARWQ